MLGQEEKCLTQHDNCLTVFRRILRYAETQKSVKGVKFMNKKFVLFVVLVLGFIFAEEKTFIRTDSTRRVSGKTEIQTQLELEDYIASQIIKEHTVLIEDVFKEFRTSDGKQIRQATVIATLAPQRRKIIKNWEDDMLFMTLELTFNPQDIERNLNNYRTNRFYKQKFDSRTYEYSLLRDSLQYAIDSAEIVRLYNELSHQSALPYIIKGDIENDNRVAIRYYEKALAIAPRLAEIYMKIGDRYLLLVNARNAMRNAAEFYRRALELGGDTTHIYYCQGQILLIEGYKDGIIDNRMLAESIRKFREVIKRDKNFQNVNRNIGFAFLLLAQKYKNDLHLLEEYAVEAIIYLQKHLEKKANDKETEIFLKEAYDFLLDAE